MKKHFMFMMAVLMGLTISLGSCNNSSKKSSDDDEEDSEKTDKKKGKKSSKKDSKSKKSAKNSDTYEEEDWEYDDEEVYGSGSNSSYDDDDFDFDDIDDIDDLKDIDVNSLTCEQANKVLQIICLHADEFIGDSNQNVSMSMRGSDVVITTSIDMSAQGVTPQLFQALLDTPDMKNQILGEMFEDSDAKEVAKVILKANKNLLMQFNDTATGGSASVRFTRSDLTKYAY